MAHKIIWSLQARDDLREVVSFIAADNPALAETFGYRLMSKVDVLANFPLIGRVVPEENDENIREIILSLTGLFTRCCPRKKWWRLPASGTVRVGSR